jgi:DNA polymerase I
VIKAATLAALPYREVWATDFEFVAHPGERQDPVCLVAHGLHTGRKIKLWRDQFGPMPPYPTDAGALFVAYYASAELGCHRTLGWPVPERIFDLFPEFLEHTNGLGRPAGNGLTGALIYYGLEHIDATEKTEMRDLVMRETLVARRARSDSRLLRKRRACARTPVTGDVAAS